MAYDDWKADIGDWPDADAEVRECTGCGEPCHVDELDGNGHCPDCGLGGTT